MLDLLAQFAAHQARVRLALCLSADAGTAPAHSPARPPRSYPMVWVAGRGSGLEPHRPVKPDKHNALKAIWAGPVRIVANGLRVRVPPARSCGQWRWRDGLAPLPPGVNSTIRLVPETNASLFKEHDRHA